MKGMLIMGPKPKGYGPKDKGPDAGKGGNSMADEAIDDVVASLGAGDSAGAKAALKAAINLIAEESKG